MNASLKFVRVLFVALSIIFLITYAFTIFPNTPYLINVAVGGAIGLAFSSFFILGETILEEFSLRKFNVLALGILFGVLMGKASLLLFENMLYFLLGSGINEHIFGFIETGIFLICTYLGIVITLKNSDQLSLSIPFIKFQATETKNQSGTFMLSTSALSDPRTIELASSGLLGTKVIIPDFLMDVLHDHVARGDEIMRSKAKKIFDTIKKLENIPDLQISYSEKDFPDTTDIKIKSFRLANFLKANLLVADTSPITSPEAKDARIININTIANSLKPIMSAGEFLKIKIQRYGKEANQGIGYLDNGTMVVVNGGGDYLGETIDARVLSVKHTHSGRMIFCNVNEQEDVLPNQYMDTSEDFYEENVTNDLPV